MSDWTYHDAEDAPEVKGDVPLMDAKGKRQAVKKAPKKTYSGRDAKPVKGIQERIDEQGGAGWSYDTEETLGMHRNDVLGTVNRAVLSPVEAAYTGLQYLGAGSEYLAEQVDNLARRSGAADALSVGGNKFLPGSAAMALGEAFPAGAPEINPAQVDLFIKRKPNFTVEDLKQLGVENAEAVVAARDSGTPIGKSIKGQAKPVPTGEGDSITFDAGTPKERTVDVTSYNTDELKQKIDKRLAGLDEGMARRAEAAADTSLKDKYGIDPAVAAATKAEEPSAGGINLRRLGTTDEEDSFIREASFDLGFTPQQHPETIGKAQELLAKKPWDEIVNHDPTLSEAPEYALANRTLLVGATKKLQQAALRVLDPATNTEAAQNEMKQLQVLLAATSDRAAGNASKAGRLLNQFRIVANADDKVLSAALKGVSDLDPVAFAQKVREFHNNPDALERLAKDSLKPLPEDYLTSLRYSMMLSGLGTHFKNILGNTLIFGTDLLADTGASIIGQLRRGDPTADRIPIHEIQARFMGLAKAITDGETYKKTAQSWREGIPVDKVSKVEKGTPILPGILEYPKKALAAEDQFFRSIIETAETYGLAMRKAYKEGLRGDEAWTRAEDLIKNPSGQMQKDIAKKAEVLQLISEPSAVAQLIERGKARRPDMGAGARTLRFTLQNAFPFTRVADNLFFTAVRNSPLSFLDKHSRAEFKAGGAARDKVIARTAIGSTIVGLMTAKAMEGSLTGDGPADFRKREELQASGWQPNSLKVGNEYHSLNIGDPLSITANVIGGLTEKFKSGELTDEGFVNGVLKTVGTVGSQLSNNSFTENIGRFMEMFDDGPRGQLARDNYFGGVAASFVPAAVRQVNNAYVDPSVRDTTGDKSSADRILGRVEASIPGLSDNLPQKYDVYGQPVIREGSLGPDLLGVAQKKTEPTDPTIAELARLGKGVSDIVVGPPQKTVKIQGFSRKLTAEEFQEYQRVSGEGIVSRTRELMSQPEWADMSDDERRDVVKDVVKAARKDAREQLFSGEPAAEWKFSDKPIALNSTDVGALLSDSFGVRVTDEGVRSNAKQKALYSQYKGVAKPGTSAHEHDRAVDIAPAKGVTPSQIKDFLTQQGFTGVRVVTKKHGSGPHWHVQWDAQGEGWTYS